MKTHRLLFATLAAIATATLGLAQSAAPGDPQRISANEWSHPLAKWRQILTNSGPILNEDPMGALVIRTPSDTKGASYFVWNHFQPVQLQDRQRLTLTFWVKVETVPDRDNNFRFGLFDSSGTRLLSDTQNWSSGELVDDVGVCYRLATDPDKSAGNQSRYYLSRGSGNAVGLTSNLGQQTQLGGLVGTGVLKKQSHRKIQMVLTREADQLDVAVYLDENLQDGGRKVKPGTWNFDSVVFSAAAGDFEFEVSMITVTSVLL